MDTSGVTKSIALDLLRSTWIVEQARALVYEDWASEEDAFAGSAARCRARAEILEAPLRGADLEPDKELVGPHAEWIRHLIGGERSGLGPLFLVRLGDWVDSHVAPLLGDGAEDLRRLGDEERSGLQFPSALPAAPAYERLPLADPEPPGEVLFTFGILGDAHIGSAGAEETVRAAIHDLNAAEVDLVIQLGDITDEGDPAEFALAKDVFADLEMPFTTMMGNHDVVARREGRLAGRELYGSHFEREPDGVVLEHKGFRFAVLDSAEHEASPFAPFDLVAGKFVDGPGGAVVRGSLTAAQHDLLADIAEPGGDPTFIFLHHPPQPYTGFPPVLFGLRDEDSGRLHATVDSGNVWAIFAGHTHRNAKTRDFDGVRAQEVGIPRDFPFGYALVDVTERGYRYRFHQLSDESLLKQGYEKTSAIHRRYALGANDERAFAWIKA
jgi:predicted phosphodiesterase